MSSSNSELIVVTPRSLGLVEHKLHKLAECPPSITAAMYEYLLAGNGVFVRGKREGMEVSIQIAECQVRGLGNAAPYFLWGYPKVPVEAVDGMFGLAMQAKSPESGEPMEVLFHLEHTSAWRVWWPEQDGSAGHVKPLDTGPDSPYARALIELHSHHQLPAYWSAADNKDEQGFRLYAVLGDVFAKPRLRVRVGLYGYFLELDPEQIFELPAGVNEEDDARWR